jgi:hypothetical protein
VQQCSACNISVTIKPTASLPWLCSFARWLPKHAPLVKKIITYDRGTCLQQVRQHGLDWQSHMEAARQILQQALQLAAAPAPAATTLPIAAAVGSTPIPQQQQQQQQQGLRLASFDSDWLVAPAVLAALPAHSLTSLNLDLKYAAAELHMASVPAGLAVAGTAVAEALARLSSLQHLSLGTHCGVSRDVSAACL